MVYKNLSRSVKTFFNVVFYPGEEHNVSGYINHPKFIRLNDFTKKIIKSLANETENVKKSSRHIKTKNNKEEVISDGTDSDK